LKLESKREEDRPLKRALRSVPSTGLKDRAKALEVGGAYPFGALEG
jgi:hypothetical protein